MKSDRELLELAAKAAGFEKWSGDSPTPGGYLAFAVWDSERRASVLWNPLTSDADAFRLAVKLRIDLHFEQQDGMGEFVEAMCLHNDEDGSCFCPHECFDDSEPNSATRRAITLAAAAIGEAMP